MRVGINAQLLAIGPGYRRAGVSRYLEGLLRALPAALAPGDEVVVWGARGVAAPAGLAASWRGSWVPAGAPPLRIVWEQAVLPLRARAARVEVLHGPVNVAPLPAPCPTVVTVHDLAFLRFPGALRPGR